MVLLKKGTAAFIVLHFDNPLLPTGAIYLLEFVNDITNDVVEVAVLNQSGSNIERYCQFGFIVDTYFANKDLGVWTYTVYKSSISPRLREKIGFGKMKLEGSDLEVTEYNGQDEDFITY